MEVPQPTEKRRRIYLSTVRDGRRAEIGTSNAKGDGRWLQMLGSANVGPCIVGSSNAAHFAVRDAGLFWRLLNGVRSAFADSVVAGAFDIGSFFDGFTLGAAIFAGSDDAATNWVSALLSFCFGHVFPPGFLLPVIKRG
jgi:hypothetical protein